MRKRKNALATLALAATLGAAGHANALPGLADGLYAIEVFYENSWQGAANKWGGCMIVSNNGNDAVPSLYHWGGSFHGMGECGLSSSRSVMLWNRQAIWQVYSIAGSDGQTAYVIKSHVNGGCLIRGQNGYQGHPSLHLWTGIGGGDAKFCGFRSADQLLANGQAAWSMAFPYGVGPSGGVVKQLRTSRPVAGFLAFSPMPGVWPNTFDRAAMAAFSNDATSWWFDFVRMGP